MSNRRPDPQSVSIVTHLEAALARADDPEARFHLRQALQKLHGASREDD